MKSCMYNCQGAGGWIVLTSERTRLSVFHCVLFIFTKPNSSVSLWTSFEVVQPILGLLLSLIHSFFVSGEVPCVWSEWYLPGCRRVWHPCLHLQAVVWGPQLHRYEDKQKKKSNLFRDFQLVCTWHLPLIFFFSTIDHTGLVTGVAFGENARFLTSTAMDRSLKFYSL